MRGSSRFIAPSLLGLAVTLFLHPALRAQSTEAYHFSSGSIQDGPAGFADMWSGPDMLPYTADDLELPECGNPGGSWAFSWIDSDGDGVLQEEEKIFGLAARRNDGNDDLQTFVAPFTLPAYGVLKDGEYFFDYHEARNTGPSHGDPCGPSAGDDFEHNDRGGSIGGAGQPGFEGANNYFWYNNDRADQRGWGGSKYYLEQRNGEGLEEIEGFYHWVTFQTNSDDPETPEFDESGSCDRNYMRSPEAVFRGLLVPVDDIAGLVDGSLDPLFGWYSGDMAAYVRDTLGPKLLDEGLTVTMSSEDCAMSESAVQPTHVLILQVEVPIKINLGGECGDGAAQAELMAAYWGIEPTTPGEPATTAIYRGSNILLFNNDLTQEGNPAFVTEPEGDEKRNLWGHDTFWRNDKARTGRYTLGGPWTITDDTSLDNGCGGVDGNFQLISDAPAFFQYPLDKELSPAEGAIYGLVELGVLEVSVDGENLGGGVGVEDTTHQIILMNGDAVAAYAELNGTQSSVNIGGTLNADGLATGPAMTMAGLAADVPLLDPLDRKYNRFVLRASQNSVKLLQAFSEEYTSNDFSGLDAYEELASIEGGIAGGVVTAVRYATPAGGETLAVVADTFAVFQNLDSDVVAGNFIRGDTNNDRGTDISDVVFLLQHLFLGGPRWVCEESADINNDEGIDISDGVFLLTHKFLGGPPPPAPYPDCGADLDGATCPESDCNEV